MHTKCHSKHIVETLPHFLGPNDLCWYIWPVMEEEDQDLASEFLIFVFWISYLENSTSFECFQNLLEVFFLLFHFWQNQFSNTFRVSLRNSEYALRFRLKTRQLLGCTFTRPYPHYHVHCWCCNKTQLIACSKMFQLAKKFRRNAKRQEKLMY